MIKIVCKDCIDRTIYCHIDCKKYKEFTNNIKRAKEYNREKGKFDCRYSY